MAIDWPNFMGLLNRHQCHGGAAHYGDGGLADCKAAGKRQNTTFVGWLYIGLNPPGLTAQNCLTAFGSFEAGCAGSKVASTGLTATLYPRGSMQMKFILLAKIISYKLIT